MTPIIWFTCLAVVWTIVDTQADEVDPLIMAVYSPKGNKSRIALLDLTDVNDENLELPPDAAKPEYFALLCESQDSRKYHNKNLNLYVQQVTKEIDSEARKLKCKHHPSPHLQVYLSINSSVVADIGYVIYVSEVLDEENESNKANKYLTKFKKEFILNTPFHEYRSYYLKDIKYDLIRNVPSFIAHTVKAHMHSNTNEGKCQEIRFNTFMIGNKKYTLGKLHDIQVDNYKWRQLVPMQDFKGIYATETTCIYFNHLLLHKKAIESLNKMENFIRDVADRLNEVHVESGTYTPEEEISLKGNEPLKDEVNVETATSTPEKNVSLERNVKNQTIIPSIVWKKITYRNGWPDFYTVLAVIHNRKTKRICEHINDVEKLGFPKYDDEKNITDIGDMYYCLVDNRINGILKIFGNEFEKPLNLNNLPSTKDDVNPLVIAVYSRKYNKKRIAFVNLANADDQNWELPLDAAKPEYFVLLCGSGRTIGNYYKYSRLIVERVTKEIDSEARKLKCKHHSVPNLQATVLGMTYTTAAILYLLDIALWEQKNPDFRSSELLTKFQDDFRIENDSFVVVLRIKYLHEHKIPACAAHMVKAHQHSNMNGKECKEIRLNIMNQSNMEPPSYTLYNIKVQDYQWRQLVPMQDFGDINVANATCTYMNFLLLHKDAIESLMKIENFIRDIADVINAVSVETGTYTPEHEVLFQGDEPNQTTIPSIVWKKITHQADFDTFYTVVVVIHNRTTKRICESPLRHFGWPKYNTKNEDDIGYMYYCFYTKETWKLLGFSTDKIKVGEEDKYNKDKIGLEPFKLKELPYKEGNIIYEINVKSKIKKNKKGKSSSGLKTILNYFGW